MSNKSDKSRPSFGGLIADVSANCKTKTSNAKNTSKIQKLKFGGH